MTVCLSVCQQVNPKTKGWNLMKKTDVSWFKLDPIKF